MEGDKDRYRKTVIKRMKRKRLTKIIGTLTAQANNQQLLEQ